MQDFAWQRKGAELPRGGGLCGGTAALKQQVVLVGEAWTSAGEVSELDVLSCSLPRPVHSSESPGSLLGR